jgi:hypothetical protein
MILNIIDNIFEDGPFLNFLSIFKNGLKFLNKCLMLFNTKLLDLFLSLYKYEKYISTSNGRS